MDRVIRTAGHFGLGGRTGLEALRWFVAAGVDAVVRRAADARLLNHVKSLVTGMPTFLQLLVGARCLDQAHAAGARHLPADP